MADYSTRLGHTHLKVRNLQRAIDFYTRYFKLAAVEQVAKQYVFLSGGDLHHEIALQALGDNAPIAAQNSVGLYHIAFEVPDKRTFALAYKALRDDGIDVGAVDHRISWAMYFPDPDGNGLEIYVDTRHEADGALLWHGINVPLEDEKIFAALQQA